MKLQDLVTERVSSDKTRYKALNREHLGSGYYANVVGSNNDPNTVVKIGRAVGDTPQKDAYLEYIKQVMTLHNPHFPQVSELKPVYNKHGQFVKYIVKLERLVELATLSPHELESIVRKLIASEEEANLLLSPPPDLIKYKGVIIRWNKGQAPRLTIDLIAMVLETKLENYPNSIQLNKSMEQAIGILRQMPQIPLLDMHSGNIMIRRSPQGPQIVFTDPFSSTEIQD